MEKIVRQTLLYDFYGELLTSHQKKLYEDAVLGDLSLSEIAEELGISRQGVHDQIRRCDRILEEYEEKLQLIRKFSETKEQVERIYSLALPESDTGRQIPGEGTELSDAEDRTDSQQRFSQIAAICDQILQTL